MKRTNEQKIKIEKGIDRDVWSLKPRHKTETFYEKQIASMEVGDSFEVKGGYMGLVGPIEGAFKRKGWKCSRRTRRTADRGTSIFRFWRIA